MKILISRAANKDSYREGEVLSMLLQYESTEAQPDQRAPNASELQVIAACLRHP